MAESTEIFAARNLSCTYVEDLAAELEADRKTVALAVLDAMRYEQVQTDNSWTALGLISRFRSNIESGDYPWAANMRGEDPDTLNAEQIAELRRSLEFLGPSHLHSEWSDRLKNLIHAAPALLDVAARCQDTQRFSQIKLAAAKGLIDEMFTVVRTEAHCVDSWRKRRAELDQ